MRLSFNEIWRKKCIHFISDRQSGHIPLISINHMQMRGTVSPLTSGISRTRYLCRLLDGALSGEVTWPSGGAPPSGDLLASRTHSDRQNHGGKIASTFRKPLVAVHINTFNSNGNSSLQEIPVKMLLSKIPESHGFLQISFFLFSKPYGGFL